VVAQLNQGLLFGVAPRDPATYPDVSPVKAAVGSVPALCRWCMNGGLVNDSGLLFCWSSDALHRPRGGV
jgi:hypothetical protein